MALERLAVVEGVVSEHSAAGLELVAISCQHVPIVVTYLVPEMAQKSSVGFAHRNTTSFALCVFGLLQSDRDVALVVPREDLRSRVGRWVSEEFERKTMRGAFVHRRKREPDEPGATRAGGAD